MVLSIRLKTIPDPEWDRRSSRSVEIFGIASALSALAVAVRLGHSHAASRHALAESPASAFHSSSPAMQLLPGHPSFPSEYYTSQPVVTALRNLVIHALVSKYCLSHVTGHPYVLVITAPYFLANTAPYFLANTAPYFLVMTALHMLLVNSRTGEYCLSQVTGGITYCRILYSHMLPVTLTY